MTLQPPPTDTLHPTLDALIASVNAHAKHQGYAVAKARSKARSGTVVKVNLRCSLGGSPRPFSSSSSSAPAPIPVPAAAPAAITDAAVDDDNNNNNNNNRPHPPRQRHRLSPKTNCPFDAYAVIKKQNAGQWELRVRNPSHNHPAFRHPAESAVHRRDALTQEVYDEIRARVVGRGQGAGVIWEEMRRERNGGGGGGGEGGWLVGKRDVANAVREVKMGRVRKRPLRRESKGEGEGEGEGNGGGASVVEEVEGGEGEVTSMQGVSELLSGSRWPDQGRDISINGNANATSISLSNLGDNHDHAVNQTKPDNCYRPGMKLFLVRFDMDP
ncbi:MAG: hypothetical protein Q9219_002592 [cf. Caloplaca sp. 3 TL-2023]